MAPVVNDDVVPDPMAIPHIGVKVVLTGMVGESSAQIFSKGYHSSLGLHDECLCVVQVINHYRTDTCVTIDSLRNDTSD